MQYPTWLTTISKKTATWLAVTATMFAGLTATTAATIHTAEAATTRDSYSDTVGNATFEAARKQYGLAQEMRHGATLHAFMWSFKTIQEHLPEIAEAGYTSIQTEPIVEIKDNRELGKGRWYLNWYYVYQPVSMNIGNYVMGTEDDFKTLCKEAHKYGIRIIVDSVSNHFTSDWDAIDPEWQNKAYFHAQKAISDYNNREDCTQNTLSGLWDLNTQNDYVAQKMHELLQRTVADGADGFRFDAAKHIELTNEFGGSQYWKTILPNGAQFQYGEVLQDANVRESDYATMFANSAVGGGGITTSNYGHEVRNALNDHSLNTRFFTDYQVETDPENMVTWVESHDNYCDRQSEKLTDDQIKLGWAVITARKNGMSLFFSRPYASGGTQEWFSEKSHIGDVGSDLWKDPEVVAVNHFRNQMEGEADNLSNCGNDGCIMVERYVSDGNSANDGVMVAADEDGGTSLVGQSVKLDNGTYTDEVTGATITVSGGKITAGSIANNQVAVFYNPTVKHTKISSAEAMPNTGEFEDTLDVTMRSFNMKNATYTTSEGDSGALTDGKIVTVGSKTKGGSKVTVAVKGTGNNGKAVSHTYSYTKTKQIDVTSVAISGDGVKNGALSMNLAKTTSAQLTVTITPSNASAKTVTWKSSDESVATVNTDGVVTGLKAGTTTITATAGGKSAALKLTLTGEIPTTAMTTVYYPTTNGWAGYYLHYKVGNGVNGKWDSDVNGRVKFEEACDGWVKATVRTDGAQLEFDITDNGNSWDNNGGKNYVASGSTIVVENGKLGTVIPCKATPDPDPEPEKPTVEKITISGDKLSNGKLNLTVGESTTLKATVTPESASSASLYWSSSDSSVASVMGTGVVTAKSTGTATITAESGDVKATVKLTVTKPAEKSPMTVYYKPASSWKKTTIAYRINGKLTHGNMTATCGGWMKFMIPDTQGYKVKTAFSNGAGTWDLNSDGNGYWGTGDTLTVTGRQVIANVTPNCISKHQ
ncbi:Ig-like domain-containing protein [Bifidobacterium biavatii]|uniref:Alpha-amylase n=3 Tax=Bifidobacterium biavatii TaxID=762212 RepID=A0A086ZSZ7_9BIFI|nr:Ig-like domain-containing protein [Bifidobacterium biavatii]KFI49647.1 alpha-amylase [Bifidobacterium biavatii DSM 23969]